MSSSARAKVTGPCPEYGRPLSWTGVITEKTAPPRLRRKTFPPGPDWRANLQGHYRINTHISLAIGIDNVNVNVNGDPITPYPSHTYFAELHWDL